MGLIQIVVVLFVLGFGLYLLETYVPMAAPIKLILRVVVILVIVLWLLQVFGITGPSVPRFH